LRAPRTAHSITSSASESRLSEILMPSAFAVLRLMTSSTYALRGPPSLAPRPGEELPTTSFSSRPRREPVLRSRSAAARSG
jgi:hypothetical protein